MAFIVEPPDLSKYNYLEVPEYDTWGVLMRKDNPLAAKEAIAFDDLLDIPIFCSEQSAKMDLPRWCSDNLDRLNILATFNLCNNGAVFVREGLGVELTFEKLVETMQKVIYASVRSHHLSTQNVCYMKNIKYSLLLLICYWKKSKKIIVLP